MKFKKYMIISISYLFLLTLCAALFSDTADTAVLIFCVGCSGLIPGWLMLFLTHREMINFFNQIDLCMDGMMKRTEQIAFPAIRGPETVMARFQNKLQRLYIMIQDSEKQIRKENKTLQTLVSDISHQVKTPLTNIKMSLSILTEKANSEKTDTEFIDTAAEQAEKLDFLLQTLIKLSRLETGVFKLNPELHSVQTILAASIGSIIPIADQKNIQFEIDCPPEIHAVFDPKWTEEVFLNILDNAVKYSPANSSVMITVSQWECYANISFLDQGPGIPEEVQAAVFKRFYRGKDTHSTDGLGIGLFLVRDILERENGFVTVHSAPGEGASFSVFLPS